MALTGLAPSPADRIAVFMGTETIVDGVPLRVVELTGEPGDMVFCHPVMVHCEVLCTVRGAAAERDAVLAKLPRGGRVVAVSAHRLLHRYVAAVGGLGFLRLLSPDQEAALQQPVQEEMLELGSWTWRCCAELGMDGRTSHAELANGLVGVDRAAANGPAPWSPSVR